MSVGTLIIVLMWAILIGGLVWALAAGRSAAQQVGYRHRARLVDVKPRLPRPAGPATAPADSSPSQAGGSEQAAGRAAAGPREAAGARSGSA